MEVSNNATNSIAPLSANEYHGTFIEERASIPADKGAMPVRCEIRSKASLVVDRILPRTEIDGRTW